ncbi:MAG TPA: hypothetical protein EYQ31_09230 [Candidatus Handelsmanbacteria bacterium]|nr:hypothetical protein [Candidatus Handelsmanbacteria bacterium]
MGIRKHAVSPRIQDIAIRIEHDHRMRAPIEDEHIVVGVYRNRCRLLVGRVILQVAPIFARGLVHVIA